MDPAAKAGLSARQNTSNARLCSPFQSEEPGSSGKLRFLPVPGAIVYCEGNFAENDGKTANGLVRHSNAYRILSVIDSGHHGRDSGEVLDGETNRIPVFGSLEAAVAHQGIFPDTLIYGMAPSNGKLSREDRKVVLKAISRGMNIVAGLHEYLGSGLIASK